MPNHNPPVAGFNKHPENINRKGRPKFSIVTIIKDKLQEVPEGEKKTRAEKLVSMYVRKLERGDKDLLKMFLPYLEGGYPAQKQNIEHEGKLTLEEFLSDQISKGKK